MEKPRNGKREREVCVCVRVFPYVFRIATLMNGGVVVVFLVKDVKCLGERNPPVVCLGGGRLGLEIRVSGCNA